MFEVFKKNKSLPALNKGEHTGKQTISIDAGSTETRGVIVATDDVDLSDLNHITEVDFCKLLAIPSGYAEIPEDLQLGRPNKNDTLADKLEYLIMKESGGDLGWTKKRLLKGSLMEASARPVSNVSSSILKVQQPQTYTNIVVAIANMLLAKSLTTGKRFSSVIPIDLTLAMPYEDMNSAKFIAEFKSKLAGSYRVIFCRIPTDKLNENGEVIDKEGNPISVSGQKPKKVAYSVRFTLAEDDILIVSEQKAVAEYYESSYEEDIVLDDSDMRTVTADVGGRSTGMILSKRSGLDESLQATFKDGGSCLLEDIKNAAVRVHKLASPPTQTQALKALITGTMNYGGRQLDCLQIVNDVKKGFARILYENFITLLDSYSVPMTAVKRVVVSGRSFGSIVKDGNIVSPSVKSYFEQLIPDSNEIEVVDIGVDYPIPWGLMQCRISKVDDEDFDLDDDFDLE